MSFITDNVVAALLFRRRCCDFTIQTKLLWLDCLDVVAVTLR